MVLTAPTSNLSVRTAHLCRNLFEQFGQRVREATSEPSSTGSSEKTKEAKPTLCEDKKCSVWSLSGRMEETTVSPETFTGRDFVAVALVLMFIIGLALLPTPGVHHQPEASVELVATEAVEEAGLPQVQEEEDACDSTLLSGPSKESTLRPHVLRPNAGMSSTLVFFVSFISWVLLAIAFNAYGKSYLKATANPVGLVVLQGAAGVVVICCLGLSRVLKLRSGAELSAPAARALRLAALCHTSQALLTNFAVFVGGVAVTNALKAMEPVAAAVFSYFLLEKKSISGVRGGALVVILCGVVLLTTKSKEGDNTRMLLSAAFTMTAVCANALRNVAIKKGDPISHHQTLLACSTAATVVGFGVMLMRLAIRGMDDLLGQGCEGPRTDGNAFGWIRIEGVSAAFCYVGCQFASFNILAFISPVGHAVGNSCKRVLVFGSGIVLLGETMSAWQFGGTAVALFGVLVYSVGGTM